MSDSMDTDDTDTSENAVSRRDLTKAGGVALASLLAPAAVSDTAAAQAGTEPRIALGQDWEIDDIDDGSGNTDIQIEHLPSGDELRYDASEGEWRSSTAFSIGGDWVLASQSLSNTDRLTVTGRSTNSNAELFLRATGTANQSRMVLTPDSNLNDYQGIILEADGTNTIGTTASGTSTPDPLAIQTGTTQHLTMETSGDINANQQHVKNASEVTTDELTVMVDGFEDQDVSEYSGTTSGWDASSDSYAGSSAITADKFTPDTDADNHAITSTSGLPNYPKAGNIFKYNFKFGASTEAVGSEFNFACQSDAEYPNRYEIDHDNGGTPAASLRRIGNTDTTFDSVTVSWPDDGSWLETQVVWGTDGTMNVTITNTSNGNELATLSGSDTTYTSGGIGFGYSEFGGGGTRNVFFDHVRLTV